MSRNSAIAVVLVALLTTSVLTAGEFFSGAAPKGTPILASDKRTDFERLQDRVDDLAFFLAEAEFAIQDQQQQINDLLAVQNQNQEFIDDLAGMISVDAVGLTITAPVITLDAAVVDLDAANANVKGIMKSQTVITKSVIAESYTPGAGNIW